MPNARIFRKLNGSSRNVEQLIYGVINLKLARQLVSLPLGRGNRRDYLLPNAAKVQMSMLVLPMS